MEKLALLTVGLAHHAPYLRLSHDLLADSLEGSTWILVDNSAEEALRPLALECGFKWVKGAAPPSGEASISGATQSLHHALGLKCGLSAISSRYLLILDPDFFLFAPGALRSLLALMKQRDLIALGVPWMPELHYKWREAPCLHCLLLDRDRVPKEALRFEPAGNPHAGGPIDKAARLSRPFGPLHSALSALHQLTTGRIGIGQSRDTGWEVAQWLRQQRGGQVELLPAAIFDQARFQHPWHLRYRWGRNLERQLPQRWSYLPPADHYRVVEGPGVAEMMRLKLDAFCLDDRLVAAHVRRSRSLFPSAEEEAVYIGRLSTLLSAMSLEPPTVSELRPRQPHDFRSPSALADRR